MDVLGVWINSRVLAPFPEASSACNLVIKDDITNAFI